MQSSQIGLKAMGDKAVLRYPKSIYGRDVLLRAISDYRRICRVSLAEDETSYVCEFRDSVVDIHLTAREFSNYLIEIANRRPDNAGM